MVDDYGKRVGVALRAVEQLHSDSSKLLLDLDKTMAGWKSVFGNYATKELTWNVRARHYMAEGLFRHYWHKDNASLVKSVTICFLGVEEPLLLVAEIEYKNTDAASLKSFCREWDPWHFYFDENDKKVQGQVLTFNGPYVKFHDLEQRTATARVIAVPLYEISRIEDVEKYLNAVAADKLPTALL